MVVLCTNLKNLKLENWNKTVFGNIHIGVQKATEVQGRIQYDGYSDNLRDQKNVAQVTLEYALKKEGGYWHEKAKVKWHVQEDRTTSYFHKIAKIKTCYAVNYLYYAWWQFVDWSWGYC